MKRAREKIKLSTADIYEAVHDFVEKRKLRQIPADQIETQTLRRLSGSNTAGFELNIIAVEGYT